MLVHVPPLGVQNLLSARENPRFAGSFGESSQEDIQKAIYGEPYYASELVDSFLENGFIDYEPLVVRKHGDKFVVVEGNRRLAAIKEILGNPEKYKDGRIDDLKNIPVLVFPDAPDEQSRNEMRVYLGVRHLMGIRGWPSISKAKYLDKEAGRPDGLTKLMQETRLDKRDIRRFLVPYRLLKSARITMPPEDDFWMLGEALGRRGVQKFVQLAVDPKTYEVKGFDQNNLRLLLDDIYGPKLARPEMHISER